MSAASTRLLRDQSLAATPIAFTAEQEEAIGHTGGWTLLSAAAGSGKTSVLAERIVRAVTGEESVPLADVLAITFTEKAAGELRERVRSALAASAQPLLARDVEQATISTIHAFCSRLLRRHALAAGLDPAFVVLDVTQAAALRTRAWDAALDGWLGDGGREALDLLAAHDVDRVKAAIASVHDDLRSQGLEPELPALAPVDLDMLILGLRTCAQAAFEENAASDLPDNVTSQNAMEGVGVCRAALATWSPGDRVPDMSQIPKAAGGGAGRLKLAGYVAYGEALALCRRRSDDARAAADYALLGDLLHRYGTGYAAAKRAEGGLDFEDLEIEAGAVLALPEVAVRMASRYRRVLVDEFQDTNPVQLQLVRRLDAEDVLVVGDEFQSIYGFRHADVAVIRGLRADLAPRGAALPLAGNFRSDPRIVTVINAAFAARFGADYTPMIARCEEDPRSVGPVVELLVTDGPAWQDKKKVPDGEPALPLAPSLGETLPPEPYWRRAEARLVAQRISDLLAAEPDLAPGDITILVRAYASMPVFEQALADVGIPSIASGGRGYWSAQQVSDLVAWLRLLANPRDEEALWHVLASPLVGAGTDAMALIVLAGREPKMRPWDTLERIFAGNSAPDDGVLGDLPPAEVARLRAFTVRLRAERDALGRHPLEALIARIVTATRYDEQVLALAGGEQRLANVRKLRRLAAGHEARHGRDLRGFLDAVVAERDAGDREADAPIGLTDDGSVQLMTIHAAKGLEFPIVCVVDTGRRPPSDDLLLTVEGTKAGLKARWLGEDGAHKAFDYPELADLAAAEDAQEYERLFYVALTRAKRRLIVSGTSGQGGPLKWLGPALVADINDDLGPAVPPQARRTAIVSHDEATAEIAVAINAPSTVGEVLRTVSLAPERARAAAAAPPADPPEPILPLVPAPAVGSEVGTVSYSSLSSYGSCGYRWYLERILRLPQERDGPLRSTLAGLDPRVRGTVVHRLLEDMDFTSPRTVEVRDVLAAAALEGAEPTTAEAAEMAALVDAFAGSALRERLTQAREVRREAGFSFVVDDEDPVLNGFIDVLAREADDALLIIDYKTDRVGSDDLEALVERDYGAQRAIYALAGLRTGAPAVEVAHVFLERPAEPAVARFTAAGITALEEQVRTLLAGITSSRFEVTLSPHRGVCAGCPGRTTLCSYPAEVTERSPEEARSGFASAEAPVVETAGVPEPPATLF